MNEKSFDRIEKKILQISEQSILRCHPNVYLFSAECEWCDLVASPL